MNWSFKAKCYDKKKGKIKVEIEFLSHVFLCHVKWVLLLIERFPKLGSVLSVLFHPTLCPDVYLIPSSITRLFHSYLLWHLVGGTSPVMRALRANTYAVLRVCSETWRRKIVSLLSAAYVTGHTPLPMFLLGPNRDVCPLCGTPLIKVDGPWFELQPALRGTLNRGNQTQPS